MATLQPERGVTAGEAADARGTAPCPPRARGPTSRRRRARDRLPCERVVRAGWQGSGVGHRAALGGAGGERAWTTRRSSAKPRNCEVRPRAQPPTILADDDPQPAAPRAKRRWRRRRRHGVRRAARRRRTRTTIDTAARRHGSGGGPSSRALPQPRAPHRKGFGVCGAQGVEGTDTEATEQGKTLAIPASPVLISGSGTVDKTCTLGPIMVFSLNGVPIFGGGVDSACTQVTYVDASEWTSSTRAAVPRTWRAFAATAPLPRPGRRTCSRRSATSPTATRRRLGGRTMASRSTDGSGRAARRSPTPPRAAADAALPRRVLGPRDGAAGRRLSSTRVLHDRRHQFGTSRRSPSVRSRLLRRAVHDRVVSRAVHARRFSRAARRHHRRRRRLRRGRRRRRHRVSILPLPCRPPPCRRLPSPAIAAAAALAAAEPSRPSSPRRRRGPRDRRPATGRATFARTLAARRRHWRTRRPHPRMAAGARSAAVGLAAAARRHHIR